MSRRSALVAAALVLIATVAGCGLFDRSSDADDRFVRNGSPQTSPSGQFIASFVEEEQDDAATLRVVITDTTGTEVFRDDYAYSERHGVGVAWLSEQDQLWVLSADVGTAHIEQNGQTWVKTTMTPETLDEIPAEIADLKTHGVDRR